MKKLLVPLVAAVFAVGGGTFAAAQTAPTPEKKVEDRASAISRDVKSHAKKSPSRTATGVVKSVSTDTVVVVGKQKGKETERTFALDPATKVTRATQVVVAADLKPGDPVRVTYSEQEGKAVAKAIAVQPEPSTKDARKRVEGAAAAKPAGKY